MAKKEFWSSHEAKSYNLNLFLSLGTSWCFWFEKFQFLFFLTECDFVSHFSFKLCEFVLWSLKPYDFISCHHFLSLWVFYRKYYCLGSSNYIGISLHEAFLFSCKKLKFSQHSAMFFSLFFYSDSNFKLCAIFNLCS